MGQDHMLPPPGEQQHQEPPVAIDNSKPSLVASLPPSYAPPPPPPSYHRSQPSPRDSASSSQFTTTPSAELPPILPPTAHNDLSANKLPSLSSLTGPPMSRPPIPTSMPASHDPELPSRPKPKPPVTHWPSMNPFTTYYTPSHAQGEPQPAAMEVDETANSNSTFNSAASPDRFDGRGPSVSLDDPEVRLAAEALGDLKADFGNSPTNRSTPVASGSPAASNTNPHTPQQEPLFSLLTTSHPLLATTIENATSAYNNSKNYSPRIKSGVEYVEGYLTPIANTVGSVSRVTGVEGGVRWFLGAGRRPSDHDGPDTGSHKRRKVNKGDEFIGFVIDPAVAPAADGDPTRDSFIFRHDRRLSRASTIDTLPAYDDHRSPAYVEREGRQSLDRPISSASARQSRLMMSTSGLAVSMSKDSLRSLKYCLRWLRKANDHIGGVVLNLKTTLDQYDQAGAPHEEGTSNETQGVEMDVDASSANRQPTEQEQRVLAARMLMLRGDIFKCLQGAIETVSKYAGGALPENARILVHNHLISLPQRFRYASMIENQSRDGTPRPNAEVTRENANRALVLAKEGLDMITQVSGVIDGTIVCAEEWCDKLGRKRSSADALLPETRQQADAKSS